MQAIRAIDGSQPHPDWGGWEAFLVSCEVRDSADGVTHFGKSNCNFILFPSGMLVLNYGFWGASLMRQVRKSGWEKVLHKIQRQRRELDDLLGKS